MNINYLCPHWGSEGKTAKSFFEAIQKEGYNGIEINLPEDNTFLNDFQAELESARAAYRAFGFIAQSVPEARKENVQEHIKRVLQRLEFLAGFSPDSINSHTGKDYFSFEDNCRVIEAIENFAIKNNIMVMHETHRGRFSFHGPSLLPYLDRFPDMKVAADFSHWCTVSESLLEGQAEVLEKVLPHIVHIHARVGHEQAPQAADPFAPEWQHHLEQYLSWWKDIKHYKTGKGDSKLTITPEAGPVPYMPAVPFTNQPLGNQWAINAKMKEYLSINL